MTDSDEPADDEPAGSSPPEDAEVPAVPAWKNPAYRFVFLFLVYLGIIAYGYPKFRVRFEWLVEWMAEATAVVEYYTFSAFTSNTTLSGAVVAYKGFAVHIIEECTGVYEVLIFAAAVLAFPTFWSKKGVGLGLGIPLLLLE